LPHEAASECLARDVLNRVGDKWSVYVIALLDSRCCQWSWPSASELLPDRGVGQSSCAAKPLW